VWLHAYVRTIGIHVTHIPNIDIVMAHKESGLPKEWKWLHTSLQTDMGMDSTDLTGVLHLQTVIQISGHGLVGLQRD